MNYSEEEDNPNLEPHVYTKYWIIKREIDISISSKIKGKKRDNFSLLLKYALDKSFEEIAISLLLIKYKLLD